MLPAPFPGTTTYQNFLWIAISNRQSYQKVINWPRRAEKVGAGFCPQKGVWRPLAASQTLCLPHPWVGKIASPPLPASIRTVGRCGVAFHAQFSPPRFSSVWAPLSPFRRARLSAPRPLHWAWGSFAAQMRHKAKWSPAGYGYYLASACGTQTLIRLNRAGIGRG